MKYCAMTGIVIMKVTKGLNVSVEKKETQWEKATEDVDGSHFLLSDRLQNAVKDEELGNHDEILLYNMIFNTCIQTVSFVNKTQS